MTDNVLLKNLVSYEFTANVVKVDVCTRVSKKLAISIWLR